MLHLCLLVCFDTTVCWYVLIPLLLVCLIPLLLVCFDTTVVLFIQGCDVCVTSVFDTTVVLFRQGLMLAATPLFVCDLNRG